MMDTVRTKFIKEALEVVDKIIYKSNDWEKGFVGDIKRLVKNNVDISNHQFNKLMEIKEKYSK